MKMFIPPGTPFKRAVVLYPLYVTLLNTAIALFITYVLTIDKNFFINWVSSMLIGFCIVTIVDGCRWIIWRNNKANGPIMFVLSIIAAPLGYFIGINLARKIFDKPVISVSLMLADSNRILLLMCILISFCFGVFFWNKNKIADLVAETEREKSRNAAIEKQAMQAQLQLLQAQIEPHMLFNTLANLQGLIAIDTDRAQNMLDQLIVYLRASLISSRTEKTTLKHEFTLMKAYLELMKVRMGKRLTYQLALPKELEAKEIAPMLLQPLVENAIKHGVEPKIEGGSIHVTAWQQDEFLRLSVSDTGLGLSSDYAENMAHIDEVGNHQRVGNANVTERLFALYGPSAKLSLENNETEGVTAQLTIPAGA